MKNVDNGLESNTVRYCIKKKLKKELEVKSTKDILISESRP